MSNKVVFEVYVDDNGTLKAATQGVRGLGAEVNKTASAHKNASKEADSHFNRQEKGVIGTANSTKNFAKLRQTLDGGSNSLVGAYATLAANIFAVSAAYLALKDAAQLQQVEAGLRSMGNQMGVTLELTTKNVQALSGGLLNAQQAARSTAQVISAGFSTKELERITVVARQASLTLGRDMTDSMDRLTRGIIKLEPELIDELGIMTRLDEATALYAVQLGKSASALTTTEKRQGFLNAALAEGELKFGGITGNDNLNNLAKLGTEFQNLTKDVLNLVNVLALPLAGLLGSRGLLIGGAVLFASTISSQLLPGLSKAAEKSTKIAQEMSKITKESAANARVTGGRQGTTFTGVKNAIKNGTADLQELQIAHSSITKQIEVNESKIAGAMNLRSRETVAGLTKSNAIRRQELVLIQQLTAAEGKAAAARAAASAINAASGDITGISSGKAAFSAMFAGISESTASYNKSLKAAAMTNGTFTATNAAMGRGLIFTKTALYGAALGAKVMGSALLNMLPIIGQVILVATLLFEGLKMLYTSIVGKEVIEANKKLKTIMDELKNKAAERKKISEASISAAVKEQKSSELLSNAIKEVTDAYNEANKARKAQLSTVGASSGIRRDGTLAAKSAVNDKSALQEINRLRLLDPLVEKAINNSIEFAGGSEKVRKSTRLQAQVLNEVNKAFTGYGPAVSATAEAMKELNVAATALTKSSIPTTQYDAFALALANTNSELAKLTVEATSSGKGVAGMAAVISGLGPDIQKFLAPDTKEAISQYNTQTAIITKLTAEGYKRTEEEKKQLKTAQDMIPTLQSRLSLASSELMLLSDTVTARQVESIVLTSIIALEQARLNKLNKTAALTGEEVKRRINAENNILAAQARQILASTWALKLELESIKLIREKDEAYKKYVATIKSGSLESELSNVAERIGAIELKIARETSTINKGLYSAEIEVLRKKEAAIASEKALRNKEAVLRAGIAAAQNQAAAIELGMTSKAVANAQALVKDREKDLNVLNDKIQIQEAAVKLAQTEYGLAAAVGTLKNSEYLSSLAYYNKILPLMKSRADLEEAVSIATINATIAEKRSAGGSGKDIAVLEAQKEAIYETTIGKKAQLDLDAKSNLFKTLGVMKDYESLELQKQSLDILLEQADALESAANSAAALIKEQRALAINKLGRELTPAEERKLSVEVAQVAYDAAVASATIKKASIDLEYKLLAAKYAYDRVSAAQKVQDLGDELQKNTWNPAELKAMQESRSAYASYITNIDKVLTSLPAATAVAVAEIDTSVKSLGVALERAKLSPTRLAGSTPAFGSSTANAPANSSISQRLTAMSEDLNPMMEKLQALGPNGTFVSAIAQGSLVIADSILKIGEAGSTTADKLSAIGTIVGQVSNIYTAGADATIAAIDAQIAAEQKRDGSSTASVAKIAALEAKKDAQAKKSFEVTKKIKMAEVAISTAAAIAGMLSAQPVGPWNIALAAATGVIGAAQLAIIAGTSYQSSASIASAAAAPSSLSIGTRSNSVDLARNNSNAGGESGYVTGAMGQGSDASNFRRAAYGGRAGIIVGEKGPEKIYPDVSSTIVSNETASKESSGGLNASFTIQAVDAEGVEKVLIKNRGAIISMLREAANANGQTFLENVNVSKYRNSGGR